MFSVVMVIVATVLSAYYHGYHTPAKVIVVLYITLLSHLVIVLVCRSFKNFSFYNKVYYYTVDFFF